MKAYPFLGTAAAGLLGYAWVENRCTLETAHYHLAHPNYHGRPLRLLLISDLHCKRDRGLHTRLFRKARELSPDYILIAGDAISRSCTDLRPVSAILRALSLNAPTYFCPGNHELDLPEAQWAEFCGVLEKNNITLLDNAVHEPEPGLRIAGASLKRSLYRDENNRFFHLEKYTCEELRTAIGAHEGFTLLLAHNPLCMDAYAQWGADLVFSGHIHGGAVRLPQIGGLLSPERMFFPRYDKGIFRRDATVMLVCGGIGKLRLFNPPQICLLTLTGQNSRQIRSKTS